MTQLRKALVWFYMLTKRLLKQWGFVVLLLTIPIIVMLTNIGMSQESGVLRAALFSEGEDEAAKRVIDKLIDEESVILFKTVDTRNEALEGVLNHKYDTAWIFPSDFSKKLDDYIGKRSTEPFVEILEREENTSLRISKEKLFGAMYDELSYSIYKNYVYSNLMSKEEVPESRVELLYNAMPRSDDIIKLEKLNEEKTGSAQINYLNSPIRGILSLIVVLCTLTAAIYFLKDRAEGKFDWMPYRKRIIPATASCLSASLLSSAAIFIAMQISGISTGFFNEIIPTVLFIIAAAGFGTVLCIIVRSPGKLGALLPGIIITMLALSPIFFNLKVLKPLRLMLPTYYYLQAVYNPKYYLYFSVYCITVYAIAFFMNMIMSNFKDKKSII